MLKSDALSKWWVLWHSSRWSVLWVFWGRTGVMCRLLLHWVVYSATGTWWTHAEVIYFGFKIHAVSRGKWDPNFPTQSCPIILCRFLFHSREMFGFLMFISTRLNMFFIFKITTSTPVVDEAFNIYVPVMYRHWRVWYCRTGHYVHPHRTHNNNYIHGMPCIFEKCSSAIYCVGRFLLPLKHVIQS